MLLFLSMQTKSRGGKQTKIRLGFSGISYSILMLSSLVMSKIQSLFFLLGFSIQIHTYPDLVQQLHLGIFRFLLLLSLIMKKDFLSPSFSQVSDRVGILNDVFNLGKAGYTSTMQVLTLMKHFENEDDFTVWCDIIQNMRLINLIWSEEEPVCIKTHGRNFFN